MILKPRPFRKLRRDRHWSRIGLVSFWPLYEGDGDEVLDLSGNGNTGTFNGAIVWSAGNFGSAIELDGTNGQYVNCGSNSVLDNISPMSLSVWIYTKGANPNSAFARILDKRPLNGQATGWSLIHETTNDFVDFLVDFDGGTDLRVQTSNSTLAKNIWQHILLTWDGSLTATNVHIYVNGIEVGYQTQTNGVGNREDDSTGTFDIGNATASSYERAFNGLIDVPSVYNRILSTFEAVQLNRNPFIMIDREPVELWIGSVVAAAGANPKGPLGHPLHGALAGPISF